MCYACEQPHGEEGDRCPKNMTRFGDETTAAWLKHAIHFRDRTLRIGQDREEARCNQNMESCVLAWEHHCIDALKCAVGETLTSSAPSGPLHLVSRTIHTGDRNARKTLGQFSGIKSRTTTDLDDLRSGVRLPLRPQRCDHAQCIVAKNVFAQKNVEPGYVLKKAIGFPTRFNSGCC